MEHAFCNNSFILSMMNELKDNPMRVVWLGDYSCGLWGSDVKGVRDGNGFIKDELQFETLYEKVWGDGAKEPTKAVWLDRMAEPFYLVNETKKRYIYMPNYFERWCGSDCVSPLALLTAIGNGQGGGDYHGINEYRVGSWAFDKIFTTDQEPSEEYMEDMDTVFAEQD